jgi:hypothetical protein
MAVFSWIVNVVYAEIWLHTTFQLMQMLAHKPKSWLKADS